MPGASGGPHGHGVDRHGASAPRSSRSDAFSSRRETEGKAACSHATALTLWSSAGVVAEACWKSARKARDITKRPQRRTRRWIRACCTRVLKKNRDRREEFPRVAKFNISTSSIDFTVSTIDLFLSVHFHL